MAKKRFSRIVDRVNPNPAFESVFPYMEQIADYGFEFPQHARHAFELIQKKHALMSAPFTFDPTTFQSELPDSYSVTGNPTVQYGNTAGPGPEKTWRTRTSSESHRNNIESQIQAAKSDEMKQRRKEWDEFIQFECKVVDPVVLAIQRDWDWRNVPDEFSRWAYRTLINPRSRERMEASNRYLDWILQFAVDGGTSEPPANRSAHKYLLGLATSTQTTKRWGPRNQLEVLVARSIQVRVASPETSHRLDQIMWPTTTRWSTMRESERLNQILWNFAQALRDDPRCVDARIKSAFDSGVELGATIALTHQAERDARPPLVFDFNQYDSGSLDQILVAMAKSTTFSPFAFDGRNVPTDQLFYAVTSPVFGRAFVSAVREAAQIETEAPKSAKQFGGHNRLQQHADALADPFSGKGGLPEEPRLELAAAIRSGIEAGLAMDTGIDTGL